MDRLLVTGVGAIIGQGILRSLRDIEDDFWLVGCDIYAEAAGQAWCDHFYQAVPASSEKYFSFLEYIVEKEKIDLIFFGTEQEMLKCLLNKFKYLNKCVLNTPNLITIAQDKWKMYQYLKKYDEPYLIPTVIEGDYLHLKRSWGAKILIKPRCSYASKGIVNVASEREYNYWKKQLGDSFMAQKIVGDDEHEFTVANFGFGDGTATNCICLRRKLGTDGATHYAEVVTTQPKMEHIVDRLTDLLKPLGPTNFQFRQEENSIFLLEINPRISSSTSIRAKMGFNEAQLCVEYWLRKNKVRHIDFHVGRVVRYVEDIACIA